MFHLTMPQTFQQFAWIKTPNEIPYRVSFYDTKSRFVAHISYSHLSDDGSYLTCFWPSGFFPAPVPECLCFQALLVTILSSYQPRMSQSSPSWFFLHSFLWLFPKIEKPLQWYVELCDPAPGRCLTQIFIWDKTKYIPVRMKSLLF